MAEVIWAARAYEHLYQIGEFIEKDSPIQAARVTQLIIKETHRLVSHIRIGQMVPEMHLDCYRELKVFSYRILYKIINENKAAIIAIVHARQILRRDLLD
jgi:plasmid stabilization system protein ParE